MEIEKINNSIEKKFLEFLNFLQMNKLSNEVIPEDKIKNDYLNNKRYSNTLDSLSDNYKGLCNPKLINNVEKSTTNQPKFKNPNSIQNNNFQVN